MATVPGPAADGDGPVRRFQTVDNHVRVVDTDDPDFRQIFARSQRRLRESKAPPIPAEVAA